MDENISFRKAGVDAGVVFKSLLFFILIPALTFPVVWLMCLSSKPGDACGDMIMFVFPLFALIGMVLGVSYLVRNVRKNNQGSMDGTGSFRKVGSGSVITAIFIAAISSLLFQYALSFLIAFLRIDPHSVFSVFASLMTYIAPFICFILVFLKLTSRQEM